MDYTPLDTLPCEYTLESCPNPAAYKYLMEDGRTSYRCEEHSWGQGKLVLPPYYHVVAVEKLENIVTEDPKVGF